MNVDSDIPDHTHLLFYLFMWSNNQQTYLQNAELSVKNLVKGIQTILKTTDDANWKAKVWNDTGQENGNKLRTYISYQCNSRRLC